MAFLRMQTAANRLMMPTRTPQGGVALQTHPVPEAIEAGDIEVGFSRQYCASHREIPAADFVGHLASIGGKSTLINALLGEALLPTGVIPLTSVVTVLQFGTACDSSVAFDDGHIEPVSPDRLSEFVTERGNPKNVRCKAALGQVCDRLTQSIQQDLNEVLRYSAQLFDIAFAPIAADMQWRRRREFSIKAWDEAPGLKALIDSLTSVLPRPIGKAIILREARRRAADLVDMHIGRLRRALEERTGDNSRTFQEDLVQGVNRTLADIESATMRGGELRQQGDAQVRPRRAELGDILARIGELEEQVREGVQCSVPDQVTERASC
jgi:hypothetical protein